MNSILVIHPYKFEGLWVFDDPRVGLSREPFVAGADVMLDRMTADIPDAAKGVTALFSTTPFPGHQFRLERQREEMGGNWYFCPQLEMQGWLCPALFKYFDVAPELIFVEVRPRSA